MPVRRTPATPSPSDAAVLRLAQLAVAARGGAEAGAGAGAAAAPVAAPVPTEDEWWADHTRIAVRPAPDPPPPTPPPALPVPGRHAARRVRLPRLPAVPGLPALPVLGVAHLAVVALAVALGLALTTWWVVRDHGRPLDQLAPVAAQPTGASGTASTGSTADAAAPLVALPTASPAAGPTAGSPAPAPGTVTVDVTGKVRRPGIVVLGPGARVVDALDAAGGARRGVDLSSLNLARLLVDGEQVVVGAPVPVGAPAPGAGPAPGAAAGLPGAPAGPLVNLNSAGQAELETLPQVGPVTAQSIVAWRTEHGGFTRVDELLEVDGIGPKTLEQLLPHVTV